jgi:hypothetical protein
MIIIDGLVYHSEFCLVCIFLITKKTMIKNDMYALKMINIAITMN